MSYKARKGAEHSKLVAELEDAAMTRMGEYANGSDIFRPSVLSSSKSTPLARDRKQMLRPMSEIGSRRKIP